MLRLNTEVILGRDTANYYSNTTNVKVKQTIVGGGVALVGDSNTTNVKVKPIRKQLELAKEIIQIQPMLRLN